MERLWIQTRLLTWFGTGSLGLVYRHCRLAKCLKIDIDKPPLCQPCLQLRGLWLCLPQHWQPEGSNPQLSHAKMGLKSSLPALLRCWLKPQCNTARNCRDIMCANWWHSVKTKTVQACHAVCLTVGWLLSLTLLKLFSTSLPKHGLCLYQHVACHYPLWS